MNKIAIVLGRGLEGCGVTKYTVELEWWLCEKDYSVTVYVDKSKKWSRNDSHGLINLVHVNFGKDEFDLKAGFEAMKAARPVKLSDFTGNIVY